MIDGSWTEAQARSRTSLSCSGSRRLTTVKERFSEELMQLEEDAPAFASILALIKRTTWVYIFEGMMQPSAPLIRKHYGAAMRESEGLRLQADNNGPVYGRGPICLEQKPALISTRASFRARMRSLPTAYS